MDQKILDHQENLANAFSWIEFAYQQGNALLEAMKKRLGDHGFPDPLSGLLYSLAKASAYKYVWLDCCWYVPKKTEAWERVAFLALSYSSWERIGSHLVVGVAELADEGAGLLTKPDKGEDRHWLLDEALNGSDYPKNFDVSAADDGLVLHSLLKPVERYHHGLKGLLSAPFPVAWISEESRLDQIAAGLVSLRGIGECAALGALSREAMASANGKASKG